MMIVRILLLLVVAWSAHAQTAVLLKLEGPIGPAANDFLSRGLEEAASDGADLVILQMDTPGGLDTSMRAMIRAILASPIPVAAYVAPGGARAASAGTYLLYASHIAAMAPATNLGAATPVQLGGGSPFGGDEEGDAPDGTNEQADADERGDTESSDDSRATADQGDPDQTEPLAGSAMERKLVNDARAYIRSLAQMRGRNVAWAEKAVREGASLSAEEAAERNVIDFIARSAEELLEKADGRVVAVRGQDQVLNTRLLAIEVREPDWRNRLLAVITHPQVAYILMLIGIYGLFFELSSPGALVPGVLGGISLLLALYAFQVLPINYAGLALLILGMGLMVGEAFVPSFGALGIGGVAAFVFGSFILWDETGPGYQVPVALVWGFTLASAVVFIGIGLLLVRARQRSLPASSQGLYQQTGHAHEDFCEQGLVQIQGELWRARSPLPLAKGAPVRVKARDGLLLEVEPITTLTKGEL